MDISSLLDGRKPYQVTRIARQEQGLSIESLASELGMGAPTIRNTEWALYSRVSPRLVSYLSLPLSHHDYYRHYQLETRILFGEDFGHLLPHPSLHNRLTYLPAAFRQLSVGEHSLAKCLCVQRADLWRLSNSLTQLPQTVFEAFHQAISLEYAQEVRDLYASN